MYVDVVERKRKIIERKLREREERLKRNKRTKKLPRPVKAIDKNGNVIVFDDMKVINKINPWITPTKIEYHCGGF